MHTPTPEKNKAQTGAALSRRAYILLAAGLATAVGLLAMAASSPSAAPEVPRQASPLPVEKLACFDTSTGGVVCGQATVWPAVETSNEPDISSTWLGGAANAEAVRKCKERGIGRDECVAALRHCTDAGTRPDLCRSLISAAPGGKR